MTGALYSWLDVDLLLQKRRAAGDWPEWLLFASAYHDGLVLRVRPGLDGARVQEFLKDSFGERYVAGVGILLQGVPGEPRPFPVEIEEGSTQEQPGKVGLQPTFRRVALFPDELGDVNWPDPFQADCPPLVAFYSFKGGVGRTTHLLGFLLALASRPKPLRTLVVDADLEAPGLTTLLHAERSFGPSEFAFVDLLALAHGERDREFGSTLGIAAHALRRQTITLAGAVPSDHYLLPAFRDRMQAVSLDIRPEHLISSPSSYWCLGDLFSRLGRALRVDAVLLDLRAGLSELASPLLFDPRVRRFVVTTPSRQSLDGTLVVLGQVRKMAPLPDRDDLFDPVLIVSFVTPELERSAGLSEIDTELMSQYPQGADELNLPTLRVEHTGFAQELLYVSSISDGLRKLSGTSLAREMESAAEEIAAQVEPSQPLPPPRELELARERLAKLATGLEYAESSGGDRFLAIAPIRGLARQFSETPPIAVTVGPKGSGKTYTCLQIVRAGLWSRFVSAVVGAPVLPEWGLLWPFFQSRNLQGPAKQAVDACRTGTLASLGVGGKFESADVEDAVRESLHNRKADETWWRHRWFKVVAESLGISVPTENAAASLLVDELRKRNQKVVLVFDGLEDLFPALGGTGVEQIALRALLQGVPNYLREVPECPLGVVVFVRGDLAQSAIPQNYGQFAKLYEPFALRWDETEALRLAVWICGQAGLGVGNSPHNKPEVMTASEAKDALLPVWGRKLGPDKSREARSAEWIIAALSDFRGQIQARDLVRFFGFAAEASRNNVTFLDRLLAPRAVREAITHCSKEKIKEITQEIKPLGDIFTRLLQHTEKIPFGTAGSGLSVEEIRFLENVGILLEDHGEFFMPEIFRLGLGLQFAQGARPKVLSLARRATR